ncbi:MAG: Gfo/Idh/MocA family oxidoreductase [Candidatus Latescibacteria bacterium]|nr:Gfo/Idh/MocA family oxidoreductase [Candidatus Latescibacterota bacterium]
MDKVRFAIIGCGGIAQSHMDAIAALPNAEVAVTVDISKERAEQAAQKYGARRWVTSTEEAVKDDAVNAVSICLPHALHEAHALIAAKAGKHILVEKPMAVSLQECDHMIAAAEAAKVTLMVGQVLRFREVNREARRLIRSGAIGKPTNVIRRRHSFTKEYRAEPWSNNPAIAGGWVLYGFGAHEMDMILYLNDAHARTTFALGRKTNPHWQDYDDIDILLNLSNDAMATMTHSINMKPGAWDCILAGTEGTLFITNDALTLNGETPPQKFDDQGGMGRQISEFVNAVLEGREPEASGRDVRRTMQALEAVKISLAEKRPVEADKL